ncbi:hypothetical protein CG018_02365 [Gemella sp. ND 6198]|uniref:two-component system activity regulator YycH n=1 Tax=Gemella sp. ND 6198 TaxID=2040624 RepID=UPI000E0A0003|nr:two-component system activity regulator YycH [Gemella sp. ND 6198]AXI26369.1 hypothetical protein CG018_02365 [Gemella sp. ND 6198]
MKKNKETIKSIILVLLVISSIFLTYVITTYQPDYEIFTKKTSQKVNDNEEKVVDDLLHFLTPNIIVKVNGGAREEPPVQNSITKIATVDGIKDKKTQKEIIKEVTKSESVETRVRNKDIEEVIHNGGEKITLEYSATLDSALVKPIFFAEENSNISLEFDTVVFLKEKPENIYLYKKGEKNYLQIKVNGDIYKKISEKFSSAKQSYGKYSLNNNFIYLKEDADKYYIDEFSTENISLNKLGRDIFEPQGGIKNSSDNEISDGYSILREQGDRLTYINPSNEEKNGTTSLASLGYAVNFLNLGYVNNQNYQLIYSYEDLTQFQETYKEGLVFNKEELANIRVLSNSSVVYQVISPKKITKTYLSSKTAGVYDVERGEYVINYLYNYANLKSVSDVVLGYEKTFSKTKINCYYKPTWYVKYNGKYISFKNLKASLEKGAE